MYFLNRYKGLPNAVLIHTNRCWLHVHNVQHLGLYLEPCWRNCTLHRYEQRNTKGHWIHSGWMLHPRSVLCSFFRLLNFYYIKKVWLYQQNTRNFYQRSFYWRVMCCHHHSSGANWVLESSLVRRRVLLYILTGNLWFNLDICVICDHSSRLYSSKLDCTSFQRIQTVIEPRGSFSFKSFGLKSSVSFGKYQMDEW